MELQFTKEVTYEFNYDGNTYLDFNYTDNIEGRRYRKYDGDISQESPIPLFFKGTNTSHQVITAELRAERVILEKENGEKKATLLYFLPDVSLYALLGYSNEYNSYNDTWNDYWSIRYLEKI